MHSKSRFVHLKGQLLPHPRSWDSWWHRLRKRREAVSHAGAEARPSEFLNLGGPVFPVPLACPTHTPPVPTWSNPNTDVVQVRQHL